MNETVLQFGAGRFLRGFVDTFVSEMNAQGQEAGTIVVVQSMGTDTINALRAQQNRFHLIVPRVDDSGERQETVSEIDSLSRALSARDDWEVIRSVARSPHLRAIVSNTTEAGLSLAGKDMPDPPSTKGMAPVSFPAKLLQVLRDRHDAGLPGLAILPCELLDDNAQILYNLVREQAGIWGWQRDEAFLAWLDASCSWVSTVADRIVPGPPADHPLLKTDPLLTVAEPYAQWTIEDKPGTEWLQHPVIRRAADVGPFALRKIRILNGAHSALVAHLRQSESGDFRFVREAVADPAIGDWLHGLLFEEILPVVQDRAPEAESYARQTLERFANPFLDHRLSDIALHHDTKVRIRLFPTYEEFVHKFGHVPARLSRVLA